MIRQRIYQIAAGYEDCNDALIVGSPVSYGCETAATRALIKRLCYP